MEIIPYQDLEGKEQLFPLMHQALGWPLDHRELEEIIEVDHRLNGPVGFCALEDNCLAGFVGVLDIPTKTFSGNQKVGGIWGVATNPTFAHRGVFKALMARSHEYFKRKKYPFSFLFTSRTLIAYDFYKKLGYKDLDWVDHISSAYKLCHGVGFEDQENKKSLDWNRIHDQYNKSVKDKTGFVIRPDNFGVVFKTRKRVDESKSIQVNNGYALLTESEGVVRIREIIASDESSYNDMLDWIEKHAEKAVVDRMVIDKKLEEIYKSREFLIQRNDYGTLMVKRLGNLSLSAAYGDKFSIRSLDTF